MSAELGNAVDHSATCIGCADLIHAHFGRRRILPVASGSLAAACWSVLHPTAARILLSNWFGVSAPAKTPTVIVERIYTETACALKSPEMRTAPNNSGAQPVVSTPAEYTTFMKNETLKWGKVIKAAGIKAE